jgi:phosphoribosylformylglycinamidine cyclo-ligase
MWRTFNCGIGMVVCVATAAQDRALELLGAAGESAFVMGHIEAGDTLPRVELRG